MWLEPPAKPNQNTEQALSDLVNYYRQLVVYHQQSAAIAASQLANLETLLNSRLQPGSVWQSATPPSFPSTNHAAMIAELDNTNSHQRLSPVELPNAEELISNLQRILSSNRGKMVRLDYLILEIAETHNIPRQQRQELRERVKQLLIQGERQGLWASIVDSPDCWTIDLRDFPDLTTPAKSKRKQKKSTRRTYNRSRLPNTGRMKEYETLTAAISQCLREHAPRTMDAHQVMAWIYPDGLSEKFRSKAYQAVSDGLNKGCSRQHWEREEIGWYYWKE